MKPRARRFRHYGSFLLTSLGLSPAAFSACTSDDGEDGTRGGAPASGGDSAGLGATGGAATG